MNLNEYQELASRTHNTSLSQDEAMCNYALGVAGEAGEVADMIKKHLFHGHVLEKDEVKKELGDVLWYIANMANILGVDLQEIAELNIDKLMKRYPEGFSQLDSIYREENK